MKRLSLILFFLLSGCIQVGPKDLPETQCPKLKVPECPKPAECPKLSVPNCSSVEQSVCKTVELPKIDNKVTIIIDGDQVQVDAGGNKLLRNYVLARELLRSR